MARRHDRRANRTRLPEVDEEVIEVQPTPVNPFPDGFPDIATKSEDTRVVGRIYYDSLKILIFGRDGLECGSDPFDVHRFDEKNNIVESRRLREIDHRRHRLG